MLSPSDLSFVNEHVLLRCDAIDGVTDGVIEDPRTCQPDIERLQCGGGSSEPCLNGAQIAALKKIYDGPRHPRTGERLHPGLAPGGELSWSLVAGSDLAPIPDLYFGRSVREDPDWDWRTFDYDEDIETASSKTGGILDAIDPDIADFRDQGGKLLLYHGWNDQVIFPEGSIAYYESVAERTASNARRAIDETRDFFRLFMVPGMAHCRGGTGADRFNAQAAIEAWVERGEAPDSIPATRLQNDALVRTRPLCAYPDVSRYRAGNPDDASSFVRAE